MKRTRLNLVLDLTSAAVMVALALTGLLMFAVLPSGSGGRNGGGALSLWGWTRHEWGDLHSILAIALVVLAIVHVWLHWSWICATLASVVGAGRLTEQSRRAWGIGTGLAVAVLVLGGWALASSQVERTPGERNLRRATSPFSVPLAQSEPIAMPAVAARPPAKVASVPARGRSPTTADDETHVRGTNRINGQTTLAEAARIGGMSAETLRDKLGLPASVDTRERLGRLKRWYGLDLYAVRNLVDPDSADQ